MSQCEFERIAGGGVQCRNCGFLIPHTPHAPDKIRRKCHQHGRRKPGLAARAVTYAKAVMRWELAGRPDRTDDQVDWILTRYCEPCEFFDGSSCTHSGCGCAVKSSAADSAGAGKVIARGLVNKLRMGTERCPIGRWPVRMLSFRKGTSAGDTGPTPLHDMEVIQGDGSGSPESVLREVAQCRPHMIANHAFSVSPEVCERIATTWPNIQVVTVCHSSQSHLVHHSSWLPIQCEFLRLARDRANCWYATPDERNHLGDTLGYPRVIVWPNTYHALPEYWKPKALGNPITISLAGRWDLIKNWPNQILAVAMVAKRRPVRLAICVKDHAEKLHEFATLLGIESHVRPWSGKEEFRAWLASEVDIGLQCSFSESWNYVALDHMARGIPIVGSSAIRLLPPAIASECSPDDPGSIAKGIESAIAYYPDAAWQARAAAEEIVTRQQIRLRDMIEIICS